MRGWDLFRRITSKLGVDILLRMWYIILARGNGKPDSTKRMGTKLFLQTDDPVETKPCP